MSDVVAAAMSLLARREHGAQELAEKLAKKGYALADIQSAIAHCQNLGLQSDQRFVEMVVRVRVRQGYGPERIRYEIQQKKIDRALCEQVFLAEQIEWVLHAQRVLQKKYKSSGQHAWPMQQKQKQFLRYRGFELHTIAQVFSQDEIIE